MHILLTGGTGFIGRNLCAKFQALEHDVSVLTRDVENAQKILPPSRLTKIKCYHIDNDLARLPEIDAVINLAGHPIADARWFPSVKKKIRSSRIDLTEKLIQKLQDSIHRPKVFISGSAIGYYGEHLEKCTETTPPGEGFSAKLCQDWERVAMQAKNQLGSRVCLIRTGLVLGPKGGLLKKLRMPFLFCLGGKLGHGQQWMSWIHLADYISIINWCLNDLRLAGPINATSPNPATNQEFTRSYAKALKRPALMTTPAFILKLIFGKMAEELLLSGQKVIPQKLIDRGFAFKYPDLLEALKKIEH